MRIASIGGSNSIINGSYNHILKEVENISINNKGIGGTNSLHGMINIIKYKLIENKNKFQLSAIYSIDMSSLPGLNYISYDNDYSHCITKQDITNNIVKEILTLNLYHY